MDPGYPISETPRNKRISTLCIAGTIAATTLLAACGAGGNADEEFPADDITLVVPYEPGGSFDLIGRRYAQLLEEELGATVVVENRGGAAATVGTSYAMQADPDGYTIGLAPGNAAAFQPMVNEGLAYEGVADFNPVGKLGDIIHSISTTVDAPWGGDFEAFVQHAKKNPGSLRVGVAGRMAQTDLLLHELMKSAGIELVSVPFSGGSGKSTAALLGGHVDAVIGSAVSQAGLVESGDIVPMAIVSTHEIALFPEIPTTAELGYPTYIEQLAFIHAPTGLAEKVQGVLESATVRIAESPEFVTFLEESGIRADPLGAEDLRTHLNDLEKQYADILDVVSP